MNIPIVFFHYNNAPYLKYTLKQASYFNPDSAIYLIGNKKNKGYSFVTHVAAEKYKAEAQEFTKIYKHRTTNDYQYELNCFLRWFYVKALCKDYNIESFFYLDSYVLMFQDIDSMVPLFGDAKIANTCDFTGMPAFTYFRDYKTISDFCDYLIYSYTHIPAIKKLDEWYRPYIDDPALMGGVSDMVLFHLYFQDHQEGTLKIDLVEDFAVDVSVHNEDGYEMENGMKKVYWQDGFPYCKQVSTGKLIRFATLHYQGGAKSKIREHYLAGGFTFARFWEDLDLKAKFKRFRRSLKGKK
jgi:hypothetical protein